MCFDSPLLQFDDYWEVDKNNDLILGIKYPEIESVLSSSEKVFLSIWRHQFNDSIPTDDFLLCSIDYNKIFGLYKGLDELKFCHLVSQSKNFRINNQNEKLNSTNNAVSN